MTSTCRRLGQWGRARSTATCLRHPRGSSQRLPRVRPRAARTEPSYPRLSPPLVGSPALPGTPVAPPLQGSPRPQPGSLLGTSTLTAASELSYNRFPFAEIGASSQLGLRGASLPSCYQDDRNSSIVTAIENETLEGTPRLRCLESLVPSGCTPRRSPRGDREPKTIGHDHQAVADADSWMEA
jgi:hypothetical protein